MKVYAPGKLILSGEHAVVHGHPAIAMAVNRYAVATISSGLIRKITLNLSDLSHNSDLTLDDLLRIKDRLKSKYQRFKRGEYHIRDVLRKPFELVQAALGILAGSHDVTLPDGMRVHVHSDIPMGSGMGSSAASILCVMKAASLHLNVPVSTDILYKMALEAENLQHGNSSGLDLRVSLHGGCVYVKGMQIETRNVPDFTFYLVDTGCPTSSTGECVNLVEPFFTQSSIGDDFAAVTNAMDDALNHHSWKKLQETVQENHTLLCKIGVVPEKVSSFISRLPDFDSVGKICGAGAVTGDNAGVVLVLTNQEKRLAALCEQYDYKLMKVKGERRGVHVA